MSPVRILHTVHAYPPDVGGSEVVVHELSKRLVERGHQVEVATCVHPERGDDGVDGVPVTGFPKTPAGVKDYRAWVHEGLDEGRWDVVMTYHSKVWSHLALAPFTKVGPRWVYCPTEFTDLHSVHPRHLVYYRTVEPMSLRNAARVKVLTRRDEERAVDIAGEQLREDIRRIPNGVDHAWWSGAGGDVGDAGDVHERYGLPRPGEAPLVIYAGGLWPHKDVETLVRALARVPEAHLVVTGGHRGRRDDLLRIAETARTVQRVHLVGKVPLEDLRALYHAADVHASASRKEGFGLTFLEAMCAGLPVVARDQGIIPELVEDGAVVTVAESEEEFAEAILLAIEADAGRNVGIASAYDWAHVTDRLEACYQELADQLARGLVRGRAP